MGKASRARWDGNVRSMAIIAKPREEITAEDLAFLRENYTSTGGLLPNAYAGGAFYTPTHVARFVIEALRGLSGGTFAPGSHFLEPSAGSGVFIEHLPEDAEITALELDETSAKVTSLLYPHANVIQGDAFRHERRDYYDYVIGNPPYGVTVDIAADDLPDEFATLSKRKGGRLGGKSEAAFIELAIKAAKPGGYIAFVLPMGLNFANYAEKARRLLYETCWHIATIGLPGETFALTGTTIPTQILIVRKAPPGTPLIPSVEKRWGSNFKRGGYDDITDFGAKFLAGQAPAYFAQITDIGYDMKGAPTPSKWDDGRTQLDELIDDFTDTLVRENLYPHIPSWHSVRDVSAFMFQHANNNGDGYRDASRTYAEGPYRWNELTLGAGAEIEWDGALVSTFDFTWQDRIVERYYAKLDRTGNGLTPELEAV